MRDYKKETEKRVEFILSSLQRSGARGIIYGNSGGKDSALVGILCKYACEDTVGLIMPCGSRSNYNEDITDAGFIAEKYNIESRLVDLGETYAAIRSTVSSAADLSNAAAANIAPRLRMTALYAVAASENRLVAGTGNKSEIYMGYFTKWGDGAFDFNPIADLTVTEIYEYLEYLGVTGRVVEKAPSGGLFDGQTDEGEMGISYRHIDEFLLSGTVTPEDREIITERHNASSHKRKLPALFLGDHEKDRGRG